MVGLLKQDSKATGPAIGQLRQPAIPLEHALLLLSKLNTDALRALGMAAACESWRPHGMFAGNLTAKPLNLP